MAISLSSTHICPNAIVERDSMANTALNEVGEVAEFYSSFELETMAIN